jgi:arylsulfatase
VAGSPSIVLPPSGLEGVVFAEGGTHERIIAADFNWLGNFGETFDVGGDLGSPVSDTYSRPFAFTGTIDKVSLDLR